MSKYVMVTGAAGFIGRHLVTALADAGHRVLAVDKLTYASDVQDLMARADAYATHVRVDISDVRALQRLPDVDAVVHLAASTHVDNSLTEGAEFVANNVGSTAHLLELLRLKSQHGIPHFIHISTDEVYGPILKDAATESAPLRPSSPYAASKAAADLLVQAWSKTYEIPYTILRPTNVYGTGQYPEKLIPKCVRCAMLGRPIPVHGDGTQTRKWLDVRDLVQAILKVLGWGPLGLPPVLNVGGNTEASVRQIADVISAGGRVHTGFVRPAGDVRYDVDDTALRGLGWVPEGDFWRDLPVLLAVERQRWRW